MTERSRFDRAWPSLVALFGTVAVVLGLLWAFGGDAGPGSGDDPVAEADDFDDDLPDNGDDSEDGGDADDESNGDGTETGEPDDPEPLPTPVVAPEELRTPIGVLNATSIAGLAGRAQERFQDGGWTVPATDNYSQSVEASTVYYPSGLQESAEAFSAQFPEVGRVEPTLPGLAQDRLVVILADDYAEAVGES